MLSVTGRSVIGRQGVARCRLDRALGARAHRLTADIPLATYLIDGAGQDCQGYEDGRYQQATPTDDLQDQKGDCMVGWTAQLRPVGLHLRTGLKHVMGERVVVQEAQEKACKGTEEARGGKPNRLLGQSGDQIEGKSGYRDREREYPEV